MNEEIAKLVDLQKIDLEIAGFDRQIEERLKTIAVREQAITEKERTLKEFQNRAHELDQQQRDIKMEHEDAGVRIKDRQNKMMQVQTSREHQALLKEIEENKKLIKETEEKLLQVMEQIEKIEQESAELQNVCKGEKELLAGETESVNKEIKKLKTQKNRVVKKRDQLAVQLRAALLKRYNMLLAKRGGQAVVKAVNGVCQGCFMTIPPQQFNEVQRGDKINLCPTCQRILYFEETSETVTA